MADKYMTFLERQKYYPHCVTENDALLGYIIKSRINSKLPTFNVWTQIHGFEWCGSREEEISLWNKRLAEYAATA